MTITYNSTDITIPNPDFGYSVTVNLSTHFEKQDNNKYTVWDDGVNYDFRVLK
jgi:myosin-crossreactive antigen